MDRGISYAEATGYLQAYCVNAAIEIEAIVRNAGMEQWAAAHLLQTASKLRAAKARVDAMFESEAA